MQSTAIISLAAITATPSATETALARRDELVLAAAGLKLVTTPEHAQIAGEHLNLRSGFGLEATGWADGGLRRLEVGTAWAFLR